MEIKNIFKKNKIILTKTQEKQFEEYCDFLQKENDKYNLTAIKNTDDIYIKHFLDSVLPYKEICEKGFLCDVGAGAGFPSVPLKILCPELNVVLFDSVGKKVNFLNALIEKLGLKNCVAVHGRVEDLAQKDEYREKFDVVVARAVAPLNVLNEYCLPFVKQGGSFFAYKAENYEKEIEDAKKSLVILNSKILKVLSFNVENMKRSVIFIKKMQKNDKKYPRSGNKPRLLPLK